MEVYYPMLALSIFIVFMAVRLVSKRHHCEKVMLLTAFMLVFICVIDWQIVGEINAHVKTVWFVGLILIGVVLAYDALGQKGYYYLKDFNINDKRHYWALENLLYGYKRDHLPAKAVLRLENRLVIIEGMHHHQIAQCLAIINDYISENDCSELKEWRAIVIFMAILQFMAVVIMMMYHAGGG